MNKFYQEVLLRLKLNLTGLPSFSRLVIYELLPYFDYKTGTISIKSLEELVSNDFYVVSCNGRKKENITADTIRNAFRSIKKAKPDHFIFNTVNQRIVITMPFIRELYEFMYNEESNKLYTLTSKAMEADHGRTKNS